jgi:hypothetical protein
LKVDKRWSDATLLKNIEESAMGYTKRQFVSAAFEEIGLASYVFDLAARAVAISLAPP